MLPRESAGEVRTGTTIALVEQEELQITLTDDDLAPESFYDPMLAKIIAWGSDRAEALHRMRDRRRRIRAHAAGVCVGRHAAAGVLGGVRAQLAVDDLPVPRVIVVRIAPGAAPDLAQLRAALAGEVPPASLDDHRGFVDRMRAMSRAAVAVGIGVVLLVFIATVLSVTFATRAAMATNRPVIEVLHLIGAKDNFIAGHFQRHFLQLGLKGGLIGGGSAIALFALAELAIGWLGGRADGNQFAALFGSFSIGALGYLAVLVQVALIAGVTALASRRTVNHTIETIH
jgi:cell division protein FtsX